MVAPANDNLADATLLPYETQTGTVNNTDATLEEGERETAFPPPDYTPISLGWSVWLKLQPPTDTIGTVTFETFGVPAWVNVFATQNSSPTPADLTTMIASGQGSVSWTAEWYHGYDLYIQITSHSTGDPENFEYTPRGEVEYTLTVGESTPPPDERGPIMFSGISGTITADTADWPDGIVVFQFVPTFTGSLTMQNDPIGLLSVFSVYNDEGELLYTDSSGGSVSVLCGKDEMVEVRLKPRYDAEIVTVQWSYAERASSRLSVILDSDEISETPGTLMANIVNGTGLDNITFTLIGPTTAEDFQTAKLNQAGSLDDFSVNLPGLQAGEYYLRVEGVLSGAEDVAFTVLDDALSMEGADPKAPPTPPLTDPQLRWRYISLDGEMTYEMVHNPKSWSNVHPPNDFTHENTTAPDGQMLTWQGGERPWRMEFAGTLTTQQEYDDLAFWANLRRRFWLIDHRNRAWLVTFEQFDAEARIVPNKPWTHNYTMKVLIFMQGN